MDHHGYSVSMTLYAWWLKIILASCIFWFIFADHRDLIQMRYITSNADADCGYTQIGYAAEDTRSQTKI